MNRLTAKRCSGIKSGYWSAAKKEELVQRLGKYEDTGLEPEEIQKDGWVETFSRMPEANVVDNRIEIGETVFAVDKNGFTYIGHFEKYRYDDYLFFRGFEVDGNCIDMVCETIDAGSITHWQPLPELPKD